MFKFIKEHQKLLLALLIIYWLVLVAATSIPAASAPSTGVGDKFEHFGAYFGLAIILNIFLHLQNKYIFVQAKSGLFTIIIGSLYGIFDELHQLLIPGRSCEFGDWLADFIGILAGVLLVRLLILKKFSAENKNLKLR